MLATGGSALMAIRCLLEAGVKESAIVFVTVVVCPEVWYGMLCYATTSGVCWCHGVKVKMMGDYDDNDDGDD